MATKMGLVSTKWLDLEFLEVLHAEKPIRYAATGKSSTKRVRSLFDKEPITIAWIDNFKEGTTLFDVGANVGMYTIYAAVMRGTKVYAFEPEALNYAELNKNIYLNDLHGQVLAYCAAITNENKVDRLLLSDFGLGISYHDFEENSWTEDKTFSADWICKKDERRPQGCIGRSIDALIADGLPVPDHVKIDVDGLEHRVVDGMRDLLKNKSVETILVEINFDNPKNLEIIDVFEKAGWTFSWNQLRCNRKVKFTIEQIKRSQSNGAGGLNYIFFRDAAYNEFFDAFFESFVPPLSLK